MLMATAWLGDDRVVVQMEQDVVEGGDLGPVGRFGLCASSWRAAIAAWSWYGPMGPRGRAAVTSAIPSSVALRSRRLRSCSAMGMSDPLGPDFIRDITPGKQPWLYRVRCRRSLGPARWCPRRRRSARTSRSEAVLAGAKPTEPAQKMNGTSILVERLYTG
jgi:hypothetical protein